MSISKDFFSLLSIGLKKNAIPFLNFKYFYLGILSLRPLINHRQKTFSPANRRQSSIFPSLSMQLSLSIFLPPIKKKIFMYFLMQTQMETYPFKNMYYKIGGFCVCIKKLPKPVNKIVKYSLTGQMKLKLLKILFKNIQKGNNLIITHLTEIIKKKKIPFHIYYIYRAVYPS